MDKRSTSSSDISLDSLENDFKYKTQIKEKISEDNVDTILVPFYENDVLMKVPKSNKNNKNKSKSNDRRDARSRKESEPRSFLINKNLQTSKKSSYLDMFRKRLNGNSSNKKKEPVEEIRSTSPQVGDTERESMDEVDNNTETEFYNTEAYNEIYYAKLINEDMEYYMDHSYEELQFTEDLEGKLQDEFTDNNLKSVSEVSQPRRPARRGPAHHIDNVKLGGLGPDMENIRPRLERARSLQRYSEKVRMANRLKIYKKTVEEDKQKSRERQASVTRQSSAHSKTGDQNKSYLINKTVQQKSSIIEKIYHGKSKSADPNKRRRDQSLPVTRHTGSNERGDQNNKKCKTARSNKISKEAVKVEHKEVTEQSRSKSRSRDQAVNTDRTETNDRHDKIPPVEISFMVNIGAGLRPSSALRTLEEQHRHYQEKVKAFTTEYKN